MIEASSIEEALRKLYSDAVKIERRKSVGGGCISKTSLITLSNGEVLFLKEDGNSSPGLMRGEALGLEALDSSEGPRVPKVFALGENDEGQFLLIEPIETGKRASDFMSSFGAELAALHAAVRSDRFGFHVDNYIGTTPQKNEWQESWIRFFGERRLRFQIDRAFGMRLADEPLKAGVYRLIESLDRFLVEPDGASILHGDLWGGNYMVDRDGRPVLIDPAVYFGHPEADLAMTELFGGFGREFYRAYDEELGIDAGYSERRDLYNLYHMLNHLNLFGRSYLGSVERIVTHYLSRLG